MEVQTVKFPSRASIENLRKQYPRDTRVELLEMDDIQAPPIGTCGTVKAVDDTGSLIVAWDNGSGLNVVYGADKVKISQTVKTICYGKSDIWESREKAEQFFLEAMISCEGSECERYTKIYTELKMGKTICTDE